MKLNSQDEYEKKYQEGYGIMYPESHIIRIYEHFLKYALGIDGKNGGKVFDFGCGNGTHALYLQSKGFEVYGVDVSAAAIEIAKERLPSCADNFKLITPDQDIDNLFNTKFDMILSNQSLYYLSKSSLQKTVLQMHTMLNNAGVVVFTMMTTKDYSYSYAEKDDDDGLQKVSFTGRLNETTYINFTKNEEDLLEKFKLFKPVFVGSYDILLAEGPTLHYYFVGKKS